MLRAFKIPDIDLLEAIYSVATVSLAQSQGSGGGSLSILEFSRGEESSGIRG